jgi:ATP adenylyltransferase/5',5'''-P-1,P-4-tetraphosphate phosphorylase II
MYFSQLSRGCCSSGGAVNPFLPYDEDLWVEHLSPTHTLLLNKFNLVAHHVIVVTREFESQDEPPSASDLEATFRAIEVGLAHAVGTPGSLLVTRTCL